MNPASSTGGTSYAGAGVDIAAGDRAVALMKAKVATATRPEVVGGLGGFAGLFALDTAKWRKPLLASSTDGVGTKIAVARAMDKHDTIGIDLVAMVLDDLVVSGAEPLFMQDYIACGKVVPERIADIVGGIAQGCRLAGAALVGGETAEHPGLMGVDDYDLAGTGVGVVEADELLGPERVAAGDVVIAMAATGLHSNGYSLVRHVLLEQAGLDLAAVIPELGRPLGEELLEPTRIYALDCLALVAGLVQVAGVGGGGVRTFAHITGGGLAANLARVLPAHLDAHLDRGTWAPAPIFDLVARLGSVSQPEIEATLNMGVGMVAVVSAEAANAALTLLAGRGLPAWVLGTVLPGTGQASLVGTHRTA